MEYATYRSDDIARNLNNMGIRPLDVMVTGVTGAGKSTTLNTLFEREIVTVGNGADPETMELTRYTLTDCFCLWDTPGLGDGVHQDAIHKRKLVDLLYKTYPKDGIDYGFIDLVLVIIEGCNRDMGTTYTLLNEVLLPNIDSDRILVVINQADMAMKGRHWNRFIHRPDSELEAFLEDQALSLQRRILETTGILIAKPVYYSATENYHTKEILDFMIDHMPCSCRSLMRHPNF